jgi:glutamyl-tRNA synthetase
MREAARAKSLPPRYNGAWRDRDPSEAPAGVKGAIRIKAPTAGETIVHDRVQGEVRFPNKDLDDFIILRSDGNPTYMHAVVVDDHDMGVTHIIRGDDHLTNAARQTVIYNAMGWDVPSMSHIPLIHGADGAKLSKRHGALGVEAYRAMGYLPEALLNYLARLGWSHGDEEMFSMKQFVEWFDLAHVSRSPAQFNPEKLSWLNQQYIKSAADSRLAALVEPELRKRGAQPGGGPALDKVVALLKDRASSIPQLADEAMLFYAVEVNPGQPLLDEIGDPNVGKALRMLKARLSTAQWARASLNEVIKDVVKANGLKMPQLAMPLRRLVTGRTQTPSIDAVLELLGREVVLQRLTTHLDED